MKKFVLVVVVFAMFFACSVTAFAKEEEEVKESYIQLGVSKSFPGAFTPSLKGEYYFKDIYHLSAGISSNFVDSISVHLHNDIKIFSIAGYDLGLKINYDLRPDRVTDITITPGTPGIPGTSSTIDISYHNAFENTFELGIYGKKLFKDKIDVRFELSAFYKLILNLYETDPQKHGFDGIKVAATVDYEANDKLDLSFKAELKVLSFSYSYINDGRNGNRYYTNIARIYFGADYKITDKLSLKVNIGVGPIWTLMSSGYSISANADADYEVNDKLDLSLSTSFGYNNDKSTLTSTFNTKHILTSASVIFKTKYKLSDKLDLSLSTNFYYRKYISKIIGTPSSSSTTSNDANISLTAEYKLSDKLDLSLSTNFGYTNDTKITDLLGLSIVITNDASINLKAEYKPTEKLFLTGSVNSKYQWIPSKILDLTLDAGVNYKFDFGLSADFGVTVELAKNISDPSTKIPTNTTLKLSLKYVF